MRFLGSVLSLGLMFVGQGAWAGIFKTLGAQILTNKLAGKQEGPRLSDLSINLDGEGLELPRGWGRWRQDMRLVGSGGLVERRVESGGGFLGLEPTTVTFKYGAEAFHVGGKGPITMPEIIRIGFDTIAEYDEGEWKIATVEWVDVDGGNDETKEGYWEGTWNLKGKSSQGKFRFYKGTREQPVDPFWIEQKGAGNWTNYPDQWCMYIYVKNVASYGQTVPRPSVNLYYSVVDLPSIILEIGSWVNRKPEDFNLTALEGKTVAKYEDEGFKIDSRRSADEIINDLQELYDFKLVEIDGLITAIPWPPPLDDAPTFTDKILRVQAGYEAKSDVAPAPIRLAEGENLTEVFEIVSTDPNRDNQSGYRYAQRENAQSRKKTSKGYSATLRGPHAAGIARTQLAEEYAQATGKDGTLGFEYLNIAAGDAAWIEMPDGERPMALDTKALTFFGPIGVKHTGFDPLAFNLPELPDTTGLQRETPIVPGTPVVFACQFPIVGGSGFYTSKPSLVIGGAAYKGDVWESLKVGYQKFVGGEWVGIDTDDLPNESIIGELTSSYTPLLPADGLVGSESFDCRLFGRSLSSPTTDGDADSFLVFKNGFAVSYREVVKTGTSPDGDLYTFSNLYAGPWGTDDFHETIAAGQRFIIVKHNGNAMGGPMWATIPNAASQLGEEMRVKFSESPDGDDEDETGFSFEPIYLEIGDFDGTNVKAPSPTLESATRGDTGALILHGRARTRFYEDAQNITTSSYSFKEYRFSDGYKYQVVLTASATVKTLELYTTDERGSFDFTIATSQLTTLFGSVPSSLTGTIALVGEYGAGRKTAFTANM